MSQKTTNQRVNFASSQNRLDYPDFLEIQIKSFQDFFQLETTADNRKNEGLFKVFQENYLTLRFPVDCCPLTHQSSH